MRSYPDFIIRFGNEKIITFWTCKKPIGITYALPWVSLRAVVNISFNTGCLPVRQPGVK